MRGKELHQPLQVYHRVQSESANGEHPQVGSSTDQRTTHLETPKPAPLNFRILAGLWWFVSVPALYLLWREPSWLKAAAGLERLRAVRLEQWVALTLILIHGILFLRAMRQSKRAK